MTDAQLHLPEEIAKNPARVVVNTRFGPVIGGRASTGAAAFLEIPYGLPPGRFEDPVPLPDDFKYEDKEYIFEKRCVPFEDKVGYGDPSENPLFLNIVTPPSFPEQRNFPVKIYIHGGFLQFGSPHTLGSQAQYVAAERSEVYVNIGYRLSAFGFLASDKPLLRGNYGFKDQWLALEWIKSNITAFGGEIVLAINMAFDANGFPHWPISRRPLGASVASSRFAPAGGTERAIYISGIAVECDPTPEAYRVQFEALCRALDLNPDAPDILTTLRDPAKVPWSSITHVIETDILGTKGTFRGCLTDDWLPTSPDPVSWQRSGGLADGLRAHGVRSVIVGDLSEEWYLYSIAHPIPTTSDIEPNLTRYLPKDVSARFVEAWRKIPDDASAEEAEKLYGEILSCGQVHLPVRVLAEDLHNVGFPVLRYAIEWAPEQNRTGGYVTHGTDRCIWALRKPVLLPEQELVAKQWLNRFDAEVRQIEKSGKPCENTKLVLTLSADTSIRWKQDKQWETLMVLKNRVLSQKMST
ncbi:hypothetical protein DXG01_007606 [Tephrocybe rancida]|nr:hypothetical protein DXG01_007606 [Tephrocybe rancida]